MTENCKKGPCCWAPLGGGWCCRRWRGRAGKRVCWRGESEAVDGVVFWSLGWWEKMSSVMEGVRVWSFWGIQGTWSTCPGGRGVPRRLARVLYRILPLLWCEFSSFPSKFFTLLPGVADQRHSPSPGSSCRQPSRAASQQAHASIEEQRLRKHRPEQGQDRRSVRAAARRDTGYLPTNTAVAKLARVTTRRWRWSTL